MLILTPRGLYCPQGGFHIDPNGACDHAVVTHAHSDHARRGAKQYYSVTCGIPLLRERLGKNINVRGFEYGEIFTINGVELSFHPAGHILGSAQVRLESNGEVWVASGDYKRDPDPTCEPFEVVNCDVFVTEATFGTPGYRWKKDADVGREIFDWWRANAERGINSVLFAYSLGKAQRVLGVLHPHAEDFGWSVHCHPATTAMTECYRTQGIKLAKTVCLSEVDEGQELSGQLFLVPQSFLKTDRAALLGEKFETAFASGWMARGAWGYDKGFCLSDHADWDDLVRTVRETKARRVYVQHRGKGALVKHLRSLGLEAFPDTDLTPRDPNQLSFF